MTDSISASIDGLILVINGGSSTLKFALFRMGTAPVRELSGFIDRIGSPEGTLRWTHEGAAPLVLRRWPYQTMPPASSPCSAVSQTG